MQLPSGRRRQQWWTPHRTSTRNNHGGRPPDQVLAHLPSRGRRRQWWRDCGRSHQRDNNAGAHPAWGRHSARPPQLGAWRTTSSLRTHCAARLYSWNATATWRWPRQHEGDRGQRRAHPLPRRVMWDTLLHRWPSIPSGLLRASPGQIRCHAGDTMTRVTGPNPNGFQRPHHVILALGSLH